MQTEQAGKFSEEVTIKWKPERDVRSSQAKYGSEMFETGKSK